MDGTIPREPSLIDAWPAVRALARHAFVFPIATVDATGAPHISPVGSVMLDREAPRGIFLEKFVRNLPRNLREDDRFAMLLVDTRATTWAAALLRGRFAGALGVRLVGRTGPRRPSTEEEQERFRRRVHGLRFLRGHGLLWSDLAHARDFTVERAIPVIAGAMTPPETLIRGGAPSQRLAPTAHAG